MPQDASQAQHGAPAPKVALVQSFLAELMEGAPPDATIGFTRPQRYGGADTGIQHLGTIPSLILEGRSIEALAACYTALNPLDRDPALNAFRPKVAELANAIERELLVCGEIELTGGGRRFHLLPRRSVLIGRPAPDKDVDVAVNCRWLSRGDRNLRLFADGAKWLVEDLGSTNGSFAAGAELKRGHPLQLPIGETLVEIGRKKNRPGPVMIALRRPAKDPGAVVISIKGRRGSTPAESDPWPSMDADANRRWIVFREQIGIGSGEDVAIQTESGETGVLAAIRYQTGFWVVPSRNRPFEVDGVAFRDALPLIREMSLRVGGATLSVGRVESQVSAPAREQQPASKRVDELSDAPEPLETKLNRPASDIPALTEAATRANRPPQRKKPRR